MLDRLSIEKQFFVGFESMIRKKLELISLEILDLLKLGFPIIRKYRSVERISIGTNIIWVGIVKMESGIV